MPLPISTELIEEDITEILEQHIRIEEEGFLQEVDESYGRFQIEKYELYIHTNVIPLG